MSEAHRESQKCKQNTEGQETVTAGYTLPDVNVPQLGELVGLCVPAMGMHAVPNGDLDIQTPWESSLLLGYYGAKPIFIEPMVARAFLLQKRSFSLAIPEIERIPQVRYPRRFRAVYLAKSKRYDFIFSY